MLATPIIVKKDGEKEPWLDVPVFYILAKNGLFLCRNHPFFKSCVPAKAWPKELAKQEREFTPNYPKVPQELFEQIVGWFSDVADTECSEAAILLVWNGESKKVELYCPEQEARVSGKKYPSPMDVHYDLPLDLPVGSFVIGDVHSHVHHSAYASWTDTSDETHSPGIHIVVGKIDKEPPDFHCEIVGDGSRFKAELEEVVEGYKERRFSYPEEWWENLAVKVLSWKPWDKGESHSASSPYGHGDEWEEGERYY